MQHDDLARQADALGAAIPEALHAGERQADRTGAMAVARIGGAEEVRLDALKPVGARRGDDALALPPVARTFKTAADLGP
jgi:hypothetical protein